MLQPIAKGVQGGAVSTIQVPVSPSQSETEYREIDDPDEVMSRLLLQNKLHLNQAYDTPFANGPLHDYVGDDGLSAGATDILNGDFDPNESENIPAINHWLKHHIRRVVPSESIRINLTIQEFKDGMKK
eukprot:10480960-Ditylum_brightwellii.AAC.1